MLAVIKNILSSENINWGILLSTSFFLLLPAILALAIKKNNYAEKSGHCRVSSKGKDNREVPGKRL